MDEIMEITDHIQEAAGQTAEVIWGYGTDPNLGEDLCVTVIATGFDATALDNPTSASAPKKVWLDDNTSEAPTANVPPVLPATEPEPFLKSDEEAPANTDRNKWDLDVPQKELFPTNDDMATADVPTPEERLAMNEDSLEFRELTNEQEVTQAESTPSEEAADVSQNEEFIIYNLDDVPEPQDLTPETNAPVADNDTDEPTATSPQPSVQPSKETFAERQRQITRSLAEFKSKLNLPGRIADLENEPAYKRRNISIDDTPQSGDSQVSRMRLNEEIDEEGNRRIELRNDNPFLHDNVD